MSRQLSWSVLLVLFFAPATESAAPPKPPRLRYLSLREAYSLAIERAGRSAGLGRADGSPEPPRRDIVRLCSRGKLTDEQADALHRAILNVEIGYWNLVGAHWSLLIREWGQHLASEAVQVTSMRFLLGQGRLADVSQALAQSELFRQQRLLALTSLRSSERELCELLGLEARTQRLIPLDSPSVTEFHTDWNRDLLEAKARSWRVTKARQQVEASKKLGRPALLLALENLKEQEEKAESYLALQHRRQVNEHGQINANRAQREAFAELLRYRQEEFLAGRSSVASLLETQRFWANALSAEFQQIVAYNNTLAGYDFGRGLRLHRAQLVASKQPLGTPRARAATSDQEPAAREDVDAPPLPVRPGLAGRRWRAGGGRGSDVVVETGSVNRARRTAEISGACEGASPLAVRRLRAEETRHEASGRGD